MVPNVHKYIDWDPTRTEQGTWRTKTFVNVWFRSETNLATMIGLLETVENELKKIPYKLHGQEVSARLEMSPKMKPLAKAPCVVLQRPRRSGRKYGKVQIIFFVGSAIVAKYTPEGEGLAGEGLSFKF